MPVGPHAGKTFYAREKFNTFFANTLRREMNMIKQQQRWIALLVTLTFMWLLQVSTMPVTAAEAATPAVAADAGQGPDHYEAVGQKAAPAKKGSILPWVLVGVGVVAVTAVVLFLFVLNKYDITGTWNFIFTSAYATQAIVITYTGDKKSGTFTMAGLPQSGGTYAVDGKKVTMLPTYFPEVTFVGEFTSKDAMSGTLTEEGEVMNWTATRGAAASLSPAPASLSKFLSN
jgi:hypothetical protein